MQMQILSTLQQILFYAIPILFAITIHEVAHGWVASKLGDKTAKILGRLSLNPIKHIDLVGTIIVPALLFMLGGFIFGWAKPVPVTWSNLNNPRRDAALVAVAGPITNLLMALFWASCLKIGLMLGGNYALVEMGKIGIQINLILFVLNLIPIPPLDGSRVISSLLPPKLSYDYNRLEPYGFFILLGLMALGVLGKILLPMVSLLGGLLLILFQI